MLSKFEQYFYNKSEPTRSCLLALKTIILETDNSIETAVKYGMPFFCVKGKMFCYLWTDKKTNHPYIGLVEGNKIEHPHLEQGNRSRMKIWRVDPLQDIPVEAIQKVLRQLLQFY